MRRVDVICVTFGTLALLSSVVLDNVDQFVNGPSISESEDYGWIQPNPPSWLEISANSTEEDRYDFQRPFKRRSKKAHRIPISLNFTAGSDLGNNTATDSLFDDIAVPFGTLTASSVVAEATSSVTHANTTEKPTYAWTTASVETSVATLDGITTPIQYSYVTQDPLPVTDSSDSAFSVVAGLSARDDYSDIFEAKVVSAMKNKKSWSEFLASSVTQQSSNRKHYVEAVSKERFRPFLHTGKAELRTKRNCYVLRTKDTLHQDTRAKVRGILEAVGGIIRFSYEMRGMNGFTVCFPEKQLPLTFLKSITGLEWVERDQYSRYSQVQEGAPWQLARLNDPSLALSEKMDYNFNATGKGVNVYTIDSGVMSKHPEFGGRARVGYSVFKDFPEDCAGHGTEVASVIVGTNVGVAKLANVTVMQVLDCDGQGENSSVLSALNWIAKNHVKPAVINMSVGGPKSVSVDEAVQAAVNAGIPVVVAAGNSRIDACSLSPSGVEAAMVVGASTYDLKRAVFSNFGSCVEIFAPGSHVVTAAIPSEATTNGYTFISGTSLSAPLVTGIYALLLQANPKSTPYELKQKILSTAPRGLLDKSTLMGSPNLLAVIPSIPSMGFVELSYVPPGTLPYLNPPSSSNTVEWILIAVGAGVAIFFILLILLVLWRRRRNAAKRRAKFSSTFQ